MTKVLTFLLMSAPIQVFLVWAACWLTLDTVREPCVSR